ncbi:MAG TPA: BON domain-containing protein [Methylophilaceae bacterium]|nr:BON domain-containing protein [Methylophilaceae bacterium]
MNMRPILVALGLASTLLVVGCDRNADTADNDVDLNTTTENAATETEQAANNAASETEQAANSVGEKIDDGVITTKVKSALLADDTVKGLDINVDTANGTVTLNGTVDNQAQADRAVEISKGIEGVGNVQSNLKVNDAAT